GPGRRDRGAALRAAGADPGAAPGPAVPPLAGAPPAGRRRRLFRQPDGMGAPELLRAAGRPAGHRVLLGGAELAARLRGGTAGRAPRPAVVRPDLALQIPSHLSPR